MEGPNISTIEHGNRPGDHRERPLERLDSHNEKTDWELLKEAQDTLLNKNLFFAFLKGQCERDTSNDSTRLARIQNLFISCLQYMPDSEIESIILQFNRQFKTYVMNHTGEPHITPELKKKILENDQKNVKGARGNIHVPGVLNVIHFIRARKKLVESQPSQKHEFYFEDVLDAKYGVDLIECFFGDDDSILEMNLIQLKSSVPEIKDQETTIHNHREWVHSSIFDMNAYEREYSDGIPDGLTIENCAENAEMVKDILLEMVTDPAGFKPDSFLDHLHLRDLSNKHRAWLLLKFGDKLREIIREAVATGDIEDENAQQILAVLEKFENEVKKKANMPKNLSSIDSINSIIAVGPKIIREEIIMSANTDPKKKKLAKVN